MGEASRSRKEAATMSQTSTSDEEQRDAAHSSTYLSRRETEILTLVAEGRTDNEIGIQLCLSAKTVSWYVKEIRARLDARSRAHAVAMAMRQGILPRWTTPEQDS
jgi:two-component system NarL family response regulator